MKQVTVRYFAAYREAVGIESESLATAATDLAGLFSEVAERHPGLARHRSALVAVNDAMSAWDAGFEDGDVILFFPPVAGG